MTRFLLVCAGGAVGSGARYLTTLAMAALLGTAFPYGTLLVNLVGSFLIAFIVQSARFSPDVQVLLTTGVLGGFTTYSAFNYDATSYFRLGATGVAVIYVMATVLGCLAAGFGGVTLARMMFAR